MSQWIIDNFHTLIVLLNIWKQLMREPKKNNIGTRKLQSKESRFTFEIKYSGERHLQRRDIPQFSQLTIGKEHITPRKLD